MHPPCKRLNEVQFLAGARCVSSFGRAPSWYLGGEWIEATTQHHASLAQLVGGIALRRRAVSVRIRGGAPIRLCSPMVGDAALKARTVLVRIQPQAPCRRSPIGRGNRLKPGQVQDRGLPAAPSNARLAQRQSRVFTRLRSGFRNSQRAPSRVFSSAEERRPDMAEVGGSSPPRRTIIGLSSSG